MSYSFVNPYNFISISGKSSELKPSEQPEKAYTGVIEYSILTKTPLFIPDTENDHAIKPDRYRKDGKFHKSYEFFSYKDENGQRIPIIPGSELRGMLRNNYEILTNSCLSALNDDEILSRRNAEVFSAGLIKKTGSNYQLYKAVDNLLRTKGANNLEIDRNWNKNNPDNKKKYMRKCYIQDGLVEGKKIRFDALERGKKIKPIVTAIGNGCKKTGYVLKGEAGPETKSSNQKHCLHVLELENPKASPIAKIDETLLDTVLGIYKNNGEHEYREYAAQWKKFKAGQGEEFFPVYYSEAAGKYYFSPAAITIELYHNKIKDMVKGHTPCKDREKLCPACRLFGMLKAGGNAFSVASRIRISDASVKAGQNRNYYEEPIVLKELSSPKMGNVEFYLERPGNACFWTYDYYCMDGNVIKAYAPVINGRKFYWHHPDFNLNNAKALNDEETERNMTVRPLKPGIEFEGKLFFDNISKEELDRLIFLLNCGENGAISDRKHGYKLGGAKPLGLGSIALCVDSIKLRKVALDRQNKTLLRQVVNYDEYEAPVWDETVLNSFNKMTDFNAVKSGNIDYPRVKKDDNIFGWFVENHKVYRRNKYGECKPIMQNSRSQMHFNSYMIAGRTELGTIKSNKFQEGDNRPKQNMQKSSQYHKYKK